MRSSAITFTSPKQMCLRSLPLSGLAEGQVAVVVQYSGISTSTERLLWDGRFAPLETAGYPVVPGYETVGQVIETGPNSALQTGQTVFVPGANCFEGVSSLYGASASHLVVSDRVALQLARDAQTDDVLLALAATAYHAVSGGGQQAPHTPPDLIIGHSVMGRLLARLTVAAGYPAPTVWESNSALMDSPDGYRVLRPQDDDRHDYKAIYDVTGQADDLDQWLQRIQPAGDIVLAGFYANRLAFSHAQAYKKEARLRVTSQWTRADLLAVNQLVQSGRLSLQGLITHAASAASATDAYQTAFGDVSCLKMVLDWSAYA